MKSIDSDIQNSEIRKVYLLYGEERYLISQYKDKLIKALVAPGDTMNFTVFEGENTPLGEVIDLAETMPFLAEKRVILVSSSGLFKKGGDDLADYLPGMPDSTVLLFVEKEADKRSRAFKAVKDAGRAVEFSGLDEGSLKQWVKARFRKNGKNASEQTISHFLSLCGANMGIMDTELEKLICYVGEREEITSADIDAICTVQISGKVFDMVEAVARGNQDQALSLYGDLIALKEQPLRILALIARQFHILLQVKQLKSRGLPDKEIGPMAGIPPFFVGKYASQAGLFSERELRRSLEETVSYETMIKTGQMEDKLALELLIVKYSCRKV